MRIFSSAFCLIALTLASDLAADSVYDIPLKDIYGKTTSLRVYHGQVLMVVNVASKCGLTRQYSALQSLYDNYKSRGFKVLGFPCNQFGGQEPGSNEDILKFCSGTYNVTFPIFDKLEVKGDKQHPLYKALSGPSSPFPGDVKWNFGKFLISRDGKIIKRFEPRTPPDSPEVIEAIESALKSQ